MKAFLYFVLVLAVIWGIALLIIAIEEIKVHYLANRIKDINRRIAYDKVMSSKQARRIEDLANNIRIVSKYELLKKETDEKT